MVKARKIGLLAVVALVIASCGGESSIGASGGVADGIGVHGTWTIDVYNPDGSLDQSVAFRNAITDDGRNILAQTLAGGDPIPAGTVIQDVLLGDIGGVDFEGVSPCTRPYPSLADGAPFVTNACSLAQDGDFNMVTAGEPDYPIIITGSVTAERDGTIDVVETLFPGTAFTRKVGSPLPVDVSEGQIMQVEVQITFSTVS